MSEFMQEINENISNIEISLFILLIYVAYGVDKTNKRLNKLAKIIDKRG